MPKLMKIKLNDNLGKQSNFPIIPVWEESTEVDCLNLLELFMKATSRHSDIRPRIYISQRTG